MISFFQKHHRFLFYITWFILGLFQSAFTELIPDEAYYWVYSRFPAWGYFDHPPMIGELIRWGYALFQNELGVRLICVLMSTLTLLITESLTERKNPFLFYTLALSLGALQIAGILAVPDTPLLFFTALFFYSYRYFLSSPGWKGILFLAIVTALLFYSKYHGLLIVFFTLLSNIKLLARRHTWLAGILVLVFYAPHLFWQWEHNWVSFRYHLFESNVSDYEFSNTTDYILGQLLLAGPLAGLILLPSALLCRTNNDTERSLKFTLVGVYIFFLISSFRGKVEANWPMPVLVPLLVLSHQFLLEKHSWIKSLRVISAASLLLIMAGRIYLIMDIGPDNAVKRKFHHHKEWAKAIAKKTGDKPVVFYNSHQRASILWFYGNKPAHSHNMWWSRRNNFNFWPTEDSLLGCQVFIADIYDMSQFTDSIVTKKGRVGLSADTLYAALGKIEIVPAQKKIEIGHIKSISLTCNRNITTQYLNFLKEYPEIKTKLIAGVFKAKVLIREITTDITAQYIAGQDAFVVPLHFDDIPPGRYVLRFGLQSKNYSPTHNSENIDLIIR
jgi:hypothetical protein